VENLDFVFAYIAAQHTFSEAAYKARANIRPSNFCEKRPSSTVKKTFSYNASGRHITDVAGNSSV